MSNVLLIIDEIPCTVKVKSNHLKLLWTLKKGGFTVVLKLLEYRTNVIEDYKMFNDLIFTNMNHYKRVVEIKDNKINYPVKSLGIEELMIVTSRDIIVMESSEEYNLQSYDNLNILKTIAKKFYIYLKNGKLEANIRRNVNNFKLFGVSISEKDLVIGDSYD